MSTEQVIKMSAEQVATGAVDAKAAKEQCAENKSWVQDVENPQHYAHGAFEVIDEMLLVFGPQRTYDFCIMNAWKYRARYLYKGQGDSDLAKADQYMKMAREIAEANEYQTPQANLIRQR